MEFTRCSRLCRRTSFSLETRALYPKHHRSISSTPSTSQDTDSTFTTSPPTTTTTSSTPSIRPQNAEDEIRTSGPRGSPDYIPLKRGYAPNMPIPSRKFNLPRPKIPAWQKGVPVQSVPTEKPKTIKSVGMEYERKLQAMRRGYIEWRQATYRERLQKKKEAMERPAPPPKKHFEPTFAEKMTTPSNSDQRKLEKLLFGQFTQRRVRGAGYNSPHHQKHLEKKRYEVITNYLTLYAATPEMITTNEQLDRAINRAFADGYTSAYRVETPPTYDELVDEVEGGHVGTLRGGYMNRRDKDRKNEIFNAMLGTVGEGKPGFEEVMSVIQEGFEAEEPKEGKGLEKLESLGGPVAGTKHEILAGEGLSSSVPEVEGESAIVEPNQGLFGQGERLTFGPAEIDRQVDDVVLPAGAPPLSTTSTKNYIVEPSQTASITVVDGHNVSIPATLHQIHTTPDIEYEKELLRRSYRAGFTDPRDHNTPSLPAFQPDDSSDLTFPSNIQTALTHEHTAPPKHRSIADLVEEDPSVQKFKSRKDILDTARQHAKDMNASNLFPELNSVDINDSESLDYLAQREHFEREFPWKRAKQAIDKEGWAKPTTMNRSFTNTKETVSETSPVPHESASTEEIATGETAADETFTPVVETMKSILDEIELDPSERKALEEFRAQRERKRGGKRGSPI